MRQPSPELSFHSRRSGSHPRPGGEGRDVKRLGPAGGRDSWSRVGDCTAQQEECRQAPHGGRRPHGGYELADTLLDLVAFCVANAVVPTRPAATTGATAEGEALFHSAGCGACHRPGFVTAETGGPAHFRGREIRPYTDLLLHDMGDGLANGHSEGLADGRMWRTAPLWGVGRAQTPDGRQTYLHDGRARSIDEAVL
ncbi:MAG TPA: di-heme oxidoredictase family protein [Hyphomicrobiaceae bacterium]|nr:di-heme oxidoredictase family protein [Hyphomicrobiaceae bacterium]